MIGAEYGFHNENDYSESNRDVPASNLSVRESDGDEKADENAANI